MRFTQAWHLFIGKDGKLAEHGGERVTVGLTSSGDVHLSAPAGFVMRPEPALRLSARLADAALAAGEPEPIALRTFHGLNGERVSADQDQDGIDLRTSFPRMKLSPAGARDLAAHLIACARQADDWMAAAVTDSRETASARCAGCGLAITAAGDGTWADDQGGVRCGPANPVWRDDNMNPFHEPEPEPEPETIMQPETCGICLAELPGSMTRREADEHYRAHEISGDEPISPRPEPEQ